MNPPHIEKHGFIDLRQVDMGYENHACYADEMAVVERNRDRMLAELSEWSGKSIHEVVQFIGDLTFGGRVGLTFDEQLSATHGFAEIEWSDRSRQTTEEETSEMEVASGLQPVQAP